VLHHRTAQRPSQSREAAAFSACRRPPKSDNHAGDLAAVDPPSASRRPAATPAGRDRRLPAAVTAAAFAGGANATGL